MDVKEIESKTFDPNTIRIVSRRPTTGYLEQIRQTPVTRKSQTPQKQVVKRLSVHDVELPLQI